MRLKTTIAMTTVALGLAASQAPASAHEVTIHHGNDSAFTYPQHRAGEVCDRERDGHAVYATWDLAYPYGTRSEVDSTDPGCDMPVSFPVEAIYVRLCERRTGPDSCTGWHWT
jgi:hypothetical protein